MNLRNLCTGLFAAALLVAPYYAQAQRAPLYQDGAAAPNHLGKFFAPGRFGDVGDLQGDALGRGVAPFAAQDDGAEGICTNSGPTGSPGSALCLGHDSTGAGVVSLDSYGGAPAQSLKFRVNGGESVIPGSITGAPMAAGNAALQALSTATYSSVVRVGYATRGDAPPLVYNASGSACTLNAGAGDGGSQVPSADGGCWLAAFPGGIADIRQFGADPTAVADSTTAIRNATNAKLSNGEYVKVLVPGGTFDITDMITVHNAQTMAGLGRQTSIIRVNTDFNMAALGVVRMSETSEGAELYDIGITLIQPDSADRNDYTHYPAAIYAVGGTRQIIDRVRISGAWDGINLTGNTGGTYIGFMEIGAMHTGLQTEGALDFIQIGSIEFAFFGFTGVNQLDVYRDGTSQCATFGRVDVLTVHQIVSYYCNISFTATTTLAATTIGRLIMDGSDTQLSVTGHRVVVSALHIKAFADHPAITFGASGMLEVGYLDMYADSTADAVEVNASGARFLVNSGRVLQSDPDHAAFSVLDGEMVLNNMLVRHDSSTTRTVAFVKQSGATATLRMTNNRYVAKDAGSSGAAVSVGTDIASIFIVGNDFHQWGITLPATIHDGEYGPNTALAYSATPAVSFATNGDFAPTYDAQTTTYQYLGSGRVAFTTTVQIDANAYTTASGTLNVATGIPALPANTTPVTLGQIDNVTFAAGGLLTADLAPDGKISIRLITSGAGAGNLATTAIPAGRANALIRISGTYRYH